MMERVGAQTQLKLTKSPFLLMQGFNIDYTCIVFLIGFIHQNIFALFSS